jgi:hypothetical protein
VFLPLIPSDHGALLTEVLDLIASVAANSEANAMTASRLCQTLGFWLFGCSATSRKSFADIYEEWRTASTALEHVFLAWLRGQQQLPVRLAELTSRYPPAPASARSVAAVRAAVLSEGDWGDAVTGLAEPQMPPELKRLSSAGSHTSKRAFKRSAADPANEVDLTKLAESHPRRRPIDTLNAALSAKLDFSSDSDIDDGVVEFWRFIVSQAATADGSASNFARVVADETTRIFAVVWPSDVPPSATSPLLSPGDGDHDFSLWGRRSTSSAAEGATSSPTRRRSFSVDAHTQNAGTASSQGLGVVYESPQLSGSASDGSASLSNFPNKSSSAIASARRATPNWSEFASLGFGSEDTEENLSLSFLDTRKSPTETSEGRPHSGSGGRFRIPGRRTSRFGPPAAEKGGAYDTPEQPPEAKEAKGRTISSVSSLGITEVEEAFADVWLDALSDPDVIGPWPFFALSALNPTVAQSAAETLGDGTPKPDWLLVEETLSPFKKVAAPPSVSDQRSVKIKDDGKKSKADGGRRPSLTLGRSKSSRRFSNIFGIVKSESNDGDDVGQRQQTLNPLPTSPSTSSIGEYRSFKGSKASSARIPPPMLEVPVPPIPKEHQGATNVPAVPETVPESPVVQQVEDVPAASKPVEDIAESKEENDHSAKTSETAVGETEGPELPAVSEEPAPPNVEADVAPPAAHAINEEPAPESKAPESKSEAETVEELVTPGAQQANEPEPSSVSLLPLRVISRAPLKRQLFHGLNRRRKSSRECLAETAEAPVEEAAISSPEASTDSVVPPATATHSEPEAARAPSLETVRENVPETAAPAPALDAPAQEIPSVNVQDEPAAALSVAEPEVLAAASMEEKNDPANEEPSTAVEEPTVVQDVKPTVEQEAPNVVVEQTVVEDNKPTVEQDAPSTTVEQAIVEEKPTVVDPTPAAEPTVVEPEPAVEQDAPEAEPTVVEPEPAEQDDAPEAEPTVVEDEPTVNLSSAAQPTVVPSGVPASPKPATNGNGTSVTEPSTGDVDAGLSSKSLEAPDSPVSRLSAETIQPRTAPEPSSPSPRKGGKLLNKISQGLRRNKKTSTGSRHEDVPVTAAANQEQGVEEESASIASTATETLVPAAAVTPSLPKVEDTPPTPSTPRPETNGEHKKSDASNAEDVVGLGLATPVAKDLESIAPVDEPGSPQTVHQDDVAPPPALSTADNVQRDTPGQAAEQVSQDAEATAPSAAHGKPKPVVTSARPSIDASSTSSFETAASPHAPSVQTFATANSDSE